MLDGAPLESKYEGELIELALAPAEKDLTALQQQEEDLKADFADLEADLKLPEHMRNNSSRLSLERRLRSSAAYLKTISGWKESDDPELRARYDAALKEDNHLHTLDAFNRLKKANDNLGQLPQIAPEILLDAINRIVSNKELLGKATSKRQELLTDEDSKRDTFEGALTDPQSSEQDKKNTEFAAEGAGDPRKDEDNHISEIETSISGDQQLVVALFQSLQRLPPKVRYEACGRMLEAFKALPPAKQQAALTSGDFPLTGLLQMQISAGLENLNGLDGSKRKQAFEKLCDDCRNGLESLDQAHNSIQESNLSPKDKEIAEQKHENDKRALDNSFSQIIVKEIDHNHSKIVARWTGDFSDPEVSAAAHLLLRNLNELKQNNLFRQIQDLVSAGSAVLQLLMTPEEIEMNAVKMRLAEASCAAASAVTYFIGATQLVWKTLEPLREKVEGVSLLDLCRCIPLVTGGFFHPLIGGAGAIIQLNQVANLYLAGKSLPLTELQKIQKQLMALPQTMNGMLTHYFTQLHSQMDGLHGAINQQLQLTVEAHRKMDIIYEELVKLSDTISQNHAEVINKLDNGEVSGRTKELHDKWIAGLKELQTKFLKCSKSKNSVEFLGFLKICLTDYNDRWNGLEGTQATLGHIVQKPAPYVGFIAHSLAKEEAKNHAFVAPQLLLPLAQAFLKWQESSAAELCNGDTAAEIRSHLINRLRGLCWLYEQRHAAAKAASDILDRTVKQFGSWRADRLKLELELELPLRLAPMDYLDLQAAIDRPKKMERLVALAAHHIGRISKTEVIRDKLMAIIPAHQKRCKDAFERDRPKMVGGAAIVTAGYGALAVAVANPAVGLFAAALSWTATGMGFYEAVREDDGAIYHLHGLSEGDVYRAEGAALWKTFAAMAVTPEAPALTSRKMVDISWIATTQGLEIVKVASFSLGKIEQEHTPSGKPLLAACGKKPLLQFHTFTDMTAALRDTTTVYYDPQSAIQEADMAAIAEKAGKCTLETGGFDCEELNEIYGQMSTIYGKTAGLQLLRGNFKEVDDWEVNAFKRWLGEYRIIPYRNGRDNTNQWPLLLPTQLIEAMRRQIQGELDLHFGSKKSLLTPSYSFAYNANSKGNSLNVDFRDAQGELFIYFQLPLKISDTQLTALTGRHCTANTTTTEELIAATIYLIYGGFPLWNVGYRPENEIKLKGNGQTLLLSHRAPEGESLYHTLVKSLPRPTHTAAGKELWEALEKNRKKVVEEYTKSYLHLKILLQLAYELPPTVLKDALARCNFIEPMDYLLDGLATCSSWSCATETLFTLLDELPAYQRRESEALLAKLSGPEDAASAPSASPAAPANGTAKVPASAAPVRPVPSSGTSSPAAAPTAQPTRANDWLDVDYTVVSGNCLFDNVVGQLKPRLSSEERSAQSRELRQKVVEYMRNDSFTMGEYQTTFSSWWTAANQPQRGEGRTAVKEATTWNEYCDEMAVDLTWGGDHELRAMAILLERPITVLQKGRPDRTFNEEGTKKAIYLKHNGINHYMSRIPRN
jgi:hypothetical protein